MGKVLITGVNGYIGRHVAFRLAKAGHYIHGVSLEPDCFASQSNIGYTQGDITDTQCMKVLFERNKFDAVVHLAALVHVRSADYGFDDYSRVNFRASETLFQLAAECQVPRVMFASTVEVYGPTANGAKISEDAPCRPDSDYARAKLLAEQSLASIARDAGQAFAIMRFAPVYGPGFRLNLDKRLYLRPYDVAYVMGAGKYCLHVCAVQNIIKYVEHWLAHSAPPSGIFNVADDVSQNVKELLRLERKEGRARFTVRLPYIPSMVGAAIWQASNNLMRRPNGMLNVENFSKLVRSAYWDNTKARAVAGAMPAAFELLGAQVQRSDAFCAAHCNKPMNSLIYNVTKRAFDVSLASVGLACTALPMAAIGIAIRLTSPGPAIHWSRRIGKDNREFRMPKFRTMRSDTPQMATHLMTDAASYLTPAGRLLRRTSLDELPQLYSILIGDMSFVGPRPALYNQDDLMALRSQHGLDRLIPGLTGWAQVNGRDELPIPVKVELEVFYLEHRSLFTDVKILVLTGLKVLTSEGVIH